jgi:LL-diaminopimelate aminotransferase
MSASQSPVKPLLGPSERLLNLPPYTLATVLQARDEKVRQGLDVIDLGVGNPDLRPPQRAIDALKAALDDPRVQNHRYPSFNGLPEFRAAIMQWYRGRFGVTLDPAREALALVGSMEGIFKFFLAHFNPGDTLLLCTPCYPAYLGQAAIAQVRKVEVPLLVKNRFVPDLAAIPVDAARRAKAIAINFPNNPTAATESAEFYQDLLRFAREYDLFVISDIAYCDLSLDPCYRARSFLEFDREKERTVEFHSFSKSYSMQGWRVVFAAGHAAIAVLSGPQDYCAEVSTVYRARRDAFLAAIRPLGYPVEPPRATIYLRLAAHPPALRERDGIHPRLARPGRRGGGARLRVRRGWRGLRARRAVRHGGPATRGRGPHGEGGAHLLSGLPSKPAPPAPPAPPRTPSLPPPSRPR